MNKKQSLLKRISRRIILLSTISMVGFAHSIVISYILVTKQIEWTLEQISEQKIATFKIFFETIVTDVLRNRRLLSNTNQKQKQQLLREIRWRNPAVVDVLLVENNGKVIAQNRLHFNDCFEQEWKRGMREQEPLGLILCDLDHFKLYNDTYGHLEGDRCLYTVAQQLKKAVLRGTDVVCRYGGEEFAVILPNTDDSGAEPICQRIVESINQLKIPHSASSVSSHVTLSMGFASLIPAVNLTSDMLISMSDQALYQAKNTGKNRFVLHNPEFVPCPKP